MPVVSLNPYLNLAGASKQAIELYQRVLGATIEQLTRFGDMPGMGPAERADDLVHAELRIGSSRLMLSDAGGPSTASGTMPISIGVHVSTDAELATVYAALAEGGEATMPPHATPFGGQLGVLRDRFGVQWMVSSIPV